MNKNVTFNELYLANKSIVAVRIYWLCELTGTAHFGTPCRGQRECFQMCNVMVESTL